MKRNDGCRKKYPGCENKLLTPFIRHGTNASRPLAFETMALSTIEMAGATVNADMVAADASINIR